jgi:D-serine deaminase-like pyridoxal phosphate-dependent protein
VSDLRNDLLPQRAFQAYRQSIGRRRHDLTTPALILDLELLRKNIGTMAEWTRSHAKVRPHTKIHKCVEIARLQVAAGAVGLTTATVWEALVMARAGLDNILIANEVIGEEKLQRLAEAARETHMILAVDSLEGAEALSRAAVAAGARIGVLLDIDVGLRRGGVRTQREACALATALARLPSIVFRGVMGYEGHVVEEPDRALRARQAAEAIERLIACVERLERAGFEIEIVSAGGTNTYDMTGANPRVTELQAGSYVFMDTTYGPITPAFKPALSILGTVISRNERTAILDCGTKVLAMDLGRPALMKPCAKIRAVHEEHTLLDVEDDSRLRVGEPVEMIVGYCGGTVNLNDVYYVVEDDEVVDVWPILARGPGRSLTGWEESVETRIA